MSRLIKPSTTQRIWKCYHDQHGNTPETFLFCGNEEKSLLGILVC